MEVSFDFQVGLDSQVENYCPRGMDAGCSFSSRPLDNMQMQKKTYPKALGTWGPGCDQSRRFWQGSLEKVNLLQVCRELARHGTVQAVPGTRDTGREAALCSPAGSRHCLVWLDTECRLRRPGG